MATANMDENHGKITSGVAEEKLGTQDTALPKLSPSEFRIYNRMAEHMEQFVRCKIAWHFQDTARTDA